MKPLIRAAVDSGRPPLELILDQPNRPRDRWDGKLIKALYLHDAFEVEGYPVWVEESKSVIFKPRVKVIRSVAAVEEKNRRLQKANPKGLPPGTRVFAEPVVLPGHSWPTRAEWLAKQSGENAYEPEDDAEAQKLEQRAREAEERAAAKAAANPEVQQILAELESKLQGRADRLSE